MNNKNPLVTIAIPFYNNQDTILDSIKSVFKQTYQNWELLLIDDGSSDDSLRIVNSIKDSRVKVYCDGINRGLVYRLNQIPNLAAANYLARLDADDMMHPERIEKQVAILSSDNTIDLVDTGTYSIDEMGKPMGIRGLDPINYDPVKILKKTMLLHASIMGKKQWFKSNPYNSDFDRAEDYELWCRTAKTSNFKRIQEPLYIVREGRVNVKNYIRSMNTIKKIFYIYGPQSLTKSELLIQLLIIKIKALAYVFFSFFNIHHLLSRRRNLPLSLDQNILLSNILNQIQATELNK